MCTSKSLKTANRFSRLSHNTVPSQLVAQIEQAGHRVWEALSVSEVLYLLEHENIDVVVIARPGC